MFPGSELSQIKEINEKIMKTTSLITFSINTQQVFRKKRKYNEISEDVEMKSHPEESKAL